MSQQKVLAFYGHRAEQKFCEFSNFYQHARPYQFTLPAYARRDGFPQVVQCTFAEKAIMATKAALMGDLEAFRAIDAAKNPGACKALGRQVRNWDEALWQLHLPDTAFQVVMQKFESEQGLRELLLSTGDCIIAEAAPRDSVWGIGLPVSDERVMDPAQWRGRNILGYALMQARERLRCSSCTAKSLDTELVSQPLEEASLDESLHAAGGVTGCKARRWGKACPAASEEPAPPAKPAEGLCDSFAVLDFEATCDDGKKMEPQEVIEFPIILVSASSRAIVGEFRTYVKPVCHPILTAFCTRLTGITQESVDDAPRWPEALAQAQAWLDMTLAEHNLESCTLVTCGDWDLNTMIVKQCAVSGEHVPERFRHWLNIKELFRHVIMKSARGMKDMLQELRLPLEGHHHSGLDDSRNIAKILIELLRRGAVIEDGMLSSSRAGGGGGGGGGGSIWAGRNSGYGGTKGAKQKRR